MKMDRKLRFKGFDSKWKIGKLNDICDFYSSKFNFELSLDNYVSTSNMVQNFGGIDKAEKLPKNGAREFKKGDILFSNIRTYLKKVWYASFNGGNSTDVLNFRARSKVDTKFLFYILSSEEFIEYSSKTSKGLKMPRGDKEMLMKYPISFPLDLKEQDKIATFINSFDIRIEQLKEKKELLEQYKKGVVQQIFSQKIRFKKEDGSSYEDWEVIKLGDLKNQERIKLSRGKVIPKTQMSKEYLYPVYSSSILKNGYIGNNNEYLFNEELISWSIDGGGNFFHRKKHKFSITNVSGYLKVLDKNIHCYYLYEQLNYLHSRLIFDYVNKAHPSVIVDLYTIKLPTNLEEQEKIANFLQSLSTQIEQVETEINETVSYKKGLLQQMFV
jgi:type I restriction enzyme, S subunit